MSVDPARRNDLSHDRFPHHGELRSGSDANRAPPLPPGTASTEPPPASPANRQTAGALPRPPRDLSELPDSSSPRSRSGGGRETADFVRRASGNVFRSPAPHAQTAQPAGQARPRPDESVVYLGLNTVGHQSAEEAASLRNDLAGAHARVEVIARGEADPALGPDKVRLPGAGTIVDLATPSGRAQFVSALGVSANASRAVDEVLADAPAGSRDELAGLAAVLARGERGEPVPGRLLLSGHSVGDRIYDGAVGPEYGQVTFASVKDLARALPGGAAAIKDLMFSACSTGFDGGEASGRRTPLSSWKDAFPNLQTAWGYGTTGAVHSSPSGPGALADIARWERATRGNPTELHTTANHVSTWDAREGYRLGRGA